jgi:protein SCO1
MKRRHALALRAPALALVCVLLAACVQAEPPWSLKDVSGLLPDLAFRMTDQDGKLVDAADYRGDVLLVYFGYTHCPDICPMTLAKLKAALGRLDASARQRVRVLFVTVDPKRDTPAVMAAYVHAFGPDFVGLHGTKAQLHDLTLRYRVGYRLDKPDAQGDYDVMHSTAVWMFDRAGEARYIVHEGAPAVAVADGLMRLMSASG